MKLAIALLTLVAAVLAAAPAPARVLAHASPVNSDPAANAELDTPPERITIKFTEPLETRFSDIEVFNSAGEQVDQDDTIYDSNDPTVMSVGLGNVPNGTYTVLWKTSSAVDGHFIRGSYIFAIGEPLAGGEQPGGEEFGDVPLVQSPLEPVARWLALLSGMAIVGGLVFELLIVQPALASIRNNQNVRLLTGQLARRFARLTWIAAGVFLVASILQVIIQAANLNDVALYRASGGSIGNVLFDTTWGNRWLWRTGLWAAVALALGLRLYSARKQGRVGSLSVPPTIITVLALALGLAMLLPISLTSHGAATAGIKNAAIFSDYLHLVAAAFWAGGLLHFAAAAPLFRSSISPAERRTALSAIVPRFSMLAVLSVGTLIVTGIFSAWAQVTVPRAVATPYGITLLVKLALLVPLLMLGALNLLRVRKRLSDDDQASHRLRRFVTGEALLVVLVILSVGMLTSLEPARQTESREEAASGKTLSFEDTVEGANIHLEVDPAVVGPNRFTVTLTDRLGQPITNAQDVVLVLTFLDSDLGDTVISLTSDGEGHYTWAEGYLSIAGLWQAQLDIRRPDAFDARTAFRFEAGSGSLAGGSASIFPEADTGKFLWGVELVLLGLLFLGAGIPLGGWWNRRGALVMGAGSIAAVAGVILAFNTQVAGTGTSNTANPFPPTQESLEIGQKVYAANCQSCHGTSGRGDGPAAPGLDPPPADLVVHVPLHPDRNLFGFVRNGIPNTAMVGVGDNLTDEEIWHLINYIKTLE